MKKLLLFLSLILCSVAAKAETVKLSFIDYFKNEEYVTVLSTDDLLITWEQNSSTQQPTFYTGSLEGVRIYKVNSGTNYGTMTVEPKPGKTITNLKYYGGTTVNNSKEKDFPIENGKYFFKNDVGGSVTMKYLTYDVEGAAPVAPPAPVFTPEPGHIDKGYVKFKSGTDKAYEYEYTVQYDDGTTKDLVYQEWCTGVTVPVRRNCTITAWAIDNGVRSEPTIARYTVDSDVKITVTNSMPKPTPDVAMYEAQIKIKISNAVEESIKFDIKGSASDNVITPTKSSENDTYVFNITEDTHIKVSACDKDGAETTYEEVITVKRPEIGLFIKTEDGAWQELTAPYVAPRNGTVWLKDKTNSSKTYWDYSYAGQYWANNQHNTWSYTSHPDRCTYVSLQVYCGGKVKGKAWYENGLEGYDTDFEFEFSVGDPDLNAPVVIYDPVPGEYEYGTEVNFEVTNTRGTAAQIKGTADEEMTLNKQGNKYSFALTYDPVLKIYALGGGQDTHQYDFSPVYTVKRPDAPTFTPAAGKIGKGSTVSFSSNADKAYSYAYTVQIGDETSEEVVVDNVTKVAVPVSDNCTITAWAILPNGYRSEPATATYEVAESDVKINVEVSSYSEDYPYNAYKSNVTVTVTGATDESIEFDINGITTGNAMTDTNKAADIFGFKLTEDTEINVKACDANGTTTTFSQHVDITRPNVRYRRRTTNSSPHSYEKIENPDYVEIGQYIYFDTPELQNYNWEYDWYYKDVNGTWVEQIATKENSDYVLFNAKYGFKIKGKASVPNGLEGYSTEFEVEVKVSEDLDVLSHNPSEPVIEEEEVTLTVPGGRHFLIYEYGIDGNYTTPTYQKIEGETVTLTINKMHRRYFYSFLNKYGPYYSHWREVFFTVQKEDGSLPDYGMTAHHTPYGSSDRQQVRAFAAADHSTTANMTQTRNDATGKYTFSTQLTDLSGNFALKVEDTELGGHKNQSVSSFHPEGVDCDEEHDSYVYVQNGSTYRLVNSGHASHVGLSTNPNHYHGGEILHAAPTLTVNLDPFKSANLTLYSAPETVTAVSDIAVDNDANAPVEYYNLQGVRVLNPAPGNVYIRVQGRTADKVMF